MCSSDLGNMDVLIADWTKDYLAECGIFPMGKYKDQVDASSGAFNKINATQYIAGVWGIVTCPECNQQNVDVAKGCPHCGWRRGR